jgi:hypothetical protein
MRSPRPTSARTTTSSGRGSWSWTWCRTRASPGPKSSGWTTGWQMARYGCVSVLRSLATCCCAGAWTASPDHSLKEEQYRLWLSDPLALYGVENAKLAPGLSSPRQRKKRIDGKKNTMAKTLEAHDKLIREIFEGSYQFEIPDYQRPYAWTTEQAGELFDDLYLGDAGCACLRGDQPILPRQHRPDQERSGTEVIRGRWPATPVHAHDAVRSAARR